MAASFIRLEILSLVLVILGAIIWGGRLFVARQKRLALATPSMEGAPGGISSKIRILAFSSADCTQCHTLQQPALRRLQALRGDEIDVLEIDAPASPELAKRYRILTVPSTVILNPTGEPHAINYGFANLSKLQQQIDTIPVSA